MTHPADTTTHLPPDPNPLINLVGQQITLTVVAADTGATTTFTGAIHHLTHNDGVIAELGVITDTTHPTFEVAVYQPPHGDPETTVHRDGALAAAVPVTVINPDRGLPQSTHRENTHHQLTELRARGASDAHLTQVATYLQRAQALYGNDDTCPASNPQPTVMIAPDLDPDAWTKPAATDPRVVANTLRAANVILPLQIAQAEALAHDDGDIDLLALAQFALSAYPGRDEDARIGVTACDLLGDLYHFGDAVGVNLDAPPLPSTPASRLQLLADAEGLDSQRYGVNPDAPVRHMLDRPVHLLAAALHALFDSLDAPDSPITDGDPHGREHGSANATGRAFHRYFEELTGSC